MYESADWNLLGKYLSGECNAHERALIEDWIAADTANRRLLEELYHLWNVTEVQQPEVDTNDAWDRLQERIFLQEKIKSIRPDRSPVVPHRVRRHASKIRYAGRIAAIFALLALSIVLALKPWETEPVLLVDQIDKTVSTQKGQRASIELSDGTTVRLNVESKLTFPAVFAIDRREVFLEGEAFFDVSSNEEKPFVIRTNQALVQVLGTTFDIRAYSDEEQMKVAVAEGLVFLRPTGASEQDTVQLRARYLGIVEANALNHVERGIDPGEYLAWTKNELRFSSAPFNQVVADLERWYALDIEVDLIPREVMPLNATFTDESVGEILKAISVALNVEFDRDKRKIRFYR